MSLISRISIRLALLFFVLLSMYAILFEIVLAQEGDSCQLIQQGKVIPGGTDICGNPNGCDTCPSGFKCMAPSAGDSGTCSSIQSGDVGVTAKRITASQQAWSKLWQTPTQPQYENEAIVTGTDSMNLYSTGLGQLAAPINGIPYLILGPLPETRQQMLTRGMTPPHGAVQNLASGIVTMSTSQPANTATYLADLGQQIGIYNPVYAQDSTGFSALRPVLGLWKAFRNMAYLAFVVIFVIIGFMIMFRSKVSQQAVISIQLALPQIVITLLLITFSYAIASLMIDLIYFLIYLIIYMFYTFNIIGNTTPAITKLFEQNIFGIAFQSHYAGNAAAAVGDIVNGVLDSVAGDILGAIGSGVSYLIFAIAILISLFKLFFQLLISYVGLIVSTIFSPILLLFNALPGSQSFSKWLKGIFANAVVFPVTALMLIISAALIGDNVGWGINSGVGYRGSEETNIGLPIIAGGLNTSAVQALIGIGFLMMMPKVVELVQKALGVEGGIGGMMGAIAEPLKQGFAGASFAPKKIGGAAISARQEYPQMLQQARREAILHGATGADIDARANAAMAGVGGRWGLFRQKLKTGK